MNKKAQKFLAELDCVKDPAGKGWDYGLMSYDAGPKLERTRPIPELPGHIVDNDDIVAYLLWSHQIDILKFLNALKQEFPYMQPELRPTYKKPPEAQFKFRFFVCKKLDFTRSQLVKVLEQL